MNAARRRSALFLAAVLIVAAAIGAAGLAAAVTKQSGSVAQSGEAAARSRGRPVAPSPPRPGAPSPDPISARCQVCHGELEYLRQKTTALPKAESLHVEIATVAGSAHRGQGCADCHTGFLPVPHGERTATRTCESCHAPEDSAWNAGRHAGHEGKQKVGCADCHGVHDARSVEALKQPEGIRAMNATCVGCHEAEHLDIGNPHRDSVSCAACHGAHDVQPADIATSKLTHANEAATCAGCHENAYNHWRHDVHGRAVIANLKPGDDGKLSSNPDAAPASCTDCHGGHQTMAVDSTAFSNWITRRCEGCHTGFATTFTDAYHGKAVELGSAASATCWDCHTSHSIFPENDGRSSIAEGNRVATCKVCHDNASPRFVQYDPHPNPRDRARNPVLYYSFLFMNVLLVGVLAVFGLHTLLWWVRLIIDQRRGVGHGHGEHA